MLLSVRQICFSDMRLAKSGVSLGYKLNFAKNLELTAKSLKANPLIDNKLMCSRMTFILIITHKNSCKKIMPLYILSIFLQN